VRFLELPPFHFLDSLRQIAKSFSHLHRASHQLLEHIAAMRDADASEAPGRDDQAVGAHGPIQPETKLVRHASVMIE
jgi:hypothetical protein